MAAGEVAATMANGEVAATMAAGEVAATMAAGEVAATMADGEVAATMADGEVAATMANGEVIEVPKHLLEEEHGCTEGEVEDPLPADGGKGVLSPGGSQLTDRELTPGGGGGDGGSLLPTLTTDMLPEAVAVYLRQLIELGLSSAPLERGEAPQVCLSSYLQLEQEMDAFQAPSRAESVHIFHKLMLDALNEALQLEASSISAHAADGRGSSTAMMLPPYARTVAGRCRALSDIAERSSDRTIGWMVAGQEADGSAIELQLGDLLAADSAEMEREWSVLPRMCEDVYTELADRVLVGMICEMHGGPGPL